MDASPPPVPSASEERLLARAIEVYERHGPEALESWLRKRAGSHAALERQLLALGEAGLLGGGEEAEPGPRIGRYQLLRRLGAGAMSVVHLAHDADLDRLVAVKVLTPALVGDERLRERFRREARAIALLRHPGIVPVIEVVEDDGQLFTVLEFVDGTSLEEGLARLVELCEGRAQAVTRAHIDEAFRLDEGARLPESLPALAAHWAGELAQALEHAHGAGVVHRDVKPSNIMIDEDGRARLLDFGLARILDDARMTWSQDVIGTPRYLAPEVVQRGVGDTDHRVDLFALGACLHELLTLAPPFTAVSAAQVLRQVVEHHPAPPSRTLRGVSRDLDAICAVALAKDPAKRYLDARSMADDLGRFLRGEAVQARRPSASERAREWARRRPLAAALGLVVIALGLLILGLVVRYNARLLQRTDEALAAQRSSDSALDFLQELLELSDVEELGPEVPASTLLSEGAARVREDARWDAADLVRPRLARSIGALAWGAGELELAAEQLALAEQLLSAEAPADLAADLWLLERARAANYHGNVLRARGDREAAVQRYRASLLAAAAVEREPDAKRELEALAYANLADLLGELGQVEEAEGYALRTLELCVGEDEETRANRAWGLIALARLQVKRGATEEALRSIERARAESVTRGEGFQQEAAVLDAAASLAVAMGELERAGELARAVAELYREHVGADSPAHAEALASLGTKLWRANDGAGAAEAWEEALAVLDRCQAPDHPRRVGCALGLGFRAFQASDFAAAVQHLSEAVRVMDAQAHAPVPAHYANALQFLATSEAFRFQDPPARVWLRRLEEFVAPLLEQDPALEVTLLFARGRVDWGAGAAQAALEHFERALAAIERVGDPQAYGDDIRRSRDGVLAQLEAAAEDSEEQTQNR